MVGNHLVGYKDPPCSRPSHDRPDRGRRVPCLRGRRHRHSAKGRLGPQGPPARRAGEAGPVVDPRTHPQQSAPVRARVRARARRRRCGARRCRMEHRGGVLGPLRRVGRRRRQRRRRPGGDGHPHPPRPLRPGREGARGVRGVDRPPPGRRHHDRVPLRQQRRAARGHVPLPHRLGRPGREAPRPRTGLHGRQVDGDDGRPRPAVRGQGAHRPSRMAAAHHLDPGPLAGPCLLLQRGTETAHLRRPRPAPHHPQHLPPHPAGDEPTG